MTLLEYLDRAGERRIERMKIVPPRPRDTRMLVGTLFFLGYYVLVYALLKTVVPATNAPLVRDSMLVLGPVVGAIGSALFRTDVKDEITASNSGAAFRALGKSADATVAAVGATPPVGADASQAADDVAGAAQDRADEIKGTTSHEDGPPSVQTELEP